MRSQRVRIEYDARRGDLMAITVEQFVENLVRRGLFAADEPAALQQTLPPDRVAGEVARLLEQS